jgi:broad specificity phosphatase PhoE
VTTILLARHGETDWNAEGRVQGHTDRPLNETGIEQAHALAEELAGERIDAVYASDLSRALDTARAVAEPRGLSVTPLIGLRERNFGTWEGMLDEEIRERFPEADNGPWGDDETPKQLKERVVEALLQIAEEHPGGQVLVVSHGGPMRAILRLCGLPVERIANAQVARIAVEDGAVRAIDSALRGRLHE